MSGRLSRSRAGSISKYLEQLWKRGYFNTGRTLGEVGERLASEFQAHPASPALSKALSHVDFLRSYGKPGGYRFIHRIASTSRPVTDDVLPQKLVDDLGSQFSVNVRDLRHNYGDSGNCTAFVLRKILEKLIFKAFAKHGKGDLLRKGKLFVGLDEMLQLAQTTQVGGEHFLTARTAEKIKAAKFLGDTAAHHPTINIDPEEIERQLPYVIIAYKELAEKL